MPKFGMEQEIADVVRAAIEAGRPAVWIDLLKILLPLMVGSAGTYWIQSRIAAGHQRRDEARHQSQMQHERTRHRDQMDHERALAADRFEQERRLQRDRLVVGDVLRNRAVLIDEYLVLLRKLDAFISTVGSASRQVAEGQITAGAGKKLVAQLRPDVQPHQVYEIWTRLVQVVAELADETLQETSNRMRGLMVAILRTQVETPLETFEEWNHARTQAQDRLTELRGDVTGLLADLP